MIKKFLLIFITFFVSILCGNLSVLAATGDTNGISTDGTIMGADFMIDVSGIGKDISIDGGDSKEKSMTFLGMIIQKLMILLGSIALLIMAIGAGYLIVNRGESELTTKGKNIFLGGIYALAVALCSYYLVSILVMILL